MFIHRCLSSKDEKTRFGFLERTWREYFDYQPYIKAFYEDLISDGGTN